MIVLNVYGGGVLLLMPVITIDEEKIGSYRKVKIKGNKLYLFIKRAFDIISSGIAIIILFIPIGIICLLSVYLNFKTPYWKLEIKNASKSTKKKNLYCNKNGEQFEIKLIPDVEKNKQYKHKWISPIYTSTRIGKDGKEFQFFKLRSMCHHAEDMKQTLIDLGFNEVDEPMFKMTNDPRVTWLGRFIRKTSIDELPQLLNVFLGSLSVIGPRSPLVYEYEKFNEYERQKVLVKGGLLCLWQIQHNRNDIQFEDWINLDLDYIEHRSLWLDIKILFKGAWMVLLDRSGK